MREISLSSAQQSLLIAGGQAAESPFYTAQVSISFGERVDENALKAAWMHLAAGTDVLRSAVEQKAGAAAIIGLQDEANVDWHTLDWSASEPRELAEQWRQLVDTDAGVQVGCGGAPPARIQFIILPGGAGHLLWSYNDLILDTESVFRIATQWLTVYEALRTASEPPAVMAPADSVPAVDTATLPEIWRAEIESAREVPPLVWLPPCGDGGDIARRQFFAKTIERHETKRLHAVADTLGVGFATLLSGVWSVVLSRLANHPAALVLETFSTRTRLESALGQFSLLLPVYYILPDDKRMADTLAEIEARRTRLAADAATVPPSAVPAHARPHAAFEYFEASLNDRLTLHFPRWMGADLRSLQHPASTLALRATDGDRLAVELFYSPGAWPAAVAAQFLDRFMQVLAQVADRPDIEVSELRVLLPREECLICNPALSTGFHTFGPRLIHEIFQDAAADAPSQPAVELAGEVLTFDALNLYANQLARYLRKTGLNTGDRIGICMSRTPWWPVALLGVLKAGCSGLLLNPSSRDSTVEKRMLSASAKILLTDTSTTLAEEHQRFNRIVVDAIWPTISEEKARNPQPACEPDAPAFAWFGRRGSKLRTFSHKALIGAFRSAAALQSLSNSDRVMQSAPTFAADSLAEVFATLLTGATLILRPKDITATRTTFHQFLADSRITVLRLPAPVWSQWVHYMQELSLKAPPTLRHVCIEEASIALKPAIDAWFAAAPGVSLASHHGVETTARLGFAHVFAPGETLEAPLALGSPEPGICGWTGDRKGRPLPRGLRGELYLAKAEENGEMEEPSGSVRTGLKVYCDERNVFHRDTYLTQLPGPPDNAFLAAQISAALTSHPDVFDALVELRSVADKDEPWAWIVPRDSHAGEPADLREFVSSRLPEGVKLDRIASLARLPLTPEGWIDREALPQPQAGGPPADAAERGTELEEKLRSIVRRTLSGRRIRLDDRIADGRMKPQLAAQWFQAAEREGLNVIEKDFRDVFAIRTLARKIAGRNAMPDGAWSPINPLRASGNRPPIFLVHDLDGIAEPYAALVQHLGSDQPVYALTARGIKSAESCHTTVEEMAAAYVEALQLFDKEHPYRIAGFGFGGLVAWEMARQLTAQHHPIALVAIAATIPPRPIGTLGTIKLFAAGAAAGLHGLPSLFGRKRLAITGADKNRRRDSSVERANLDAAASYRSSPANIEAHIFLPDGGDIPYRLLEAGWSILCPNALFYQVPCAPEYMLSEPAASVIGAALRKLAAAEKLDDEVESDT